MKYLSRFVLVIFILLQLTACTHVGRPSARFGSDGAPADAYTIDVSKIPDAVPKDEPRSKYGNPKSYVTNGKRYYVMNSSQGYDERGIASWYGMKFHSKRTSCGDPYNVYTMTAAHKTLPLPTYVRVTNLENGRQITVKVNDRGPFHENRVIDLSFVAAKKLGIWPKGTGLVQVTAIDPNNPTMVAQIKPEVPKDKELQLYLQLGAFAQQANATLLAKHIQALTQETVVIRTGTVNGKPIYRVQIGPLADVEASDRVHQSLQSAGVGDAITVIQ